MHCPGAMYYHEFLDEMIDDSFGVWRELSAIAPHVYGSVDVCLRDAKHAVAVEFLDRWPIVLDYGSM